MNDAAALQARLVALTRDLMLIPGCASNPQDRDRCCEFVRNHLDGLDRTTVRSFEKDGIPSLLAVPEGVEAPDVLLCGHLDVIDHPDMFAFRSHVTGTRLYGPGSGDLKGALAIMLELFREYRRKNPKASLGLLVTSDEETGGDAGVRHLFDDLGFRCGSVLVPDGGSLTEITVEEKGLLQIEMSFKGHAAHAARPWLAKNALERVCDELSKLRREFDMPTFDSTVPQQAEIHHSDSERWSPTCTLTVIDSPNRTANRVPAYAKAIVDIRFPSPQTVDEILAKVRNATTSDLEMRIILAAEPVLLTPDPIYVAAIEAVTGQPVQLVKEHGASDARFMRRIGIPVIISRPTVGNLHAEDEWIDIESMVTFYRICDAYLSQKLDADPVWSTL